ncbi:MAG: amidohydrolase family protein [Acidobacteria bacterium]|nr:amidohydrolase family protein [Acidobacteriota bacterium]
MLLACSGLLVGLLLFGPGREKQPRLPADWIWSARYVLTMAARRSILEDGAVAIGGGRILAVGGRAEIGRRYQAKRRLDRGDALIAPGLINAHTHAAMSLLRGMADDLALQEWLEKHIFPAEAKNVTPEFVRWGTRLALLEMLLSGVTTYADMYYFEDVVAETTREAGVRAVLGETIIDFPSPDARTAGQALAQTERFLARFRGDPLITPAVAPHALFTNSDQSLKAARALANRFGAPLLIHLSETRRENEEARRRRGLTPTQALERLGVFDGRTLAAHAVWVDEADLAILKARGVGLAHCPSSNMKLASGIAPVTRMLALDLAVGLGADGPAGSNNDFNLFEEMDLAAKLQKVTTGDPRALTAVAAVEMATIRGARALGLEREIGSLEAAKRADLISVSLSAPHAIPLYDPYSHFVYALKASDVRDVMVEGRLLISDRQPLTLDARQILERARALAPRLPARRR